MPDKEDSSVRLPFPTEVMVKIKSILGVSTPFLQGGSVRLTLPKRFVKKSDIKTKMQKEFVGFIFVETDRGVLLVALNKTINPTTVRDALSFANISSVSDEDLKILFKDEG